jgi:hypothetical protein
MFNGLLIKESLRDKTILDRLKTTKEETWDVKNTAEGQSPVWHVVWFEIPDEKIGEMARRLSTALEQGKWFLEVSDDSTMVVVFPGKVFTYPKGDTEGRQSATEFGRSIGIPDHQMVWKE